ncbi:MAG TPA: hypothetical protein VL475_07395 [Planctomycetaceae bacterium]|nr:hypothetical protein [Planctomycetaceae bacterium]
MTNLPGTTRRNRLVWGVACAGCLLASGCGDPRSNAGVPHSERPAAEDASFRGASEPAEEDVSATRPANGAETSPTVVDSASGDSAGPGAVAPAPAAATAAFQDRTFTVEGPDGALRIGYDDLDLLKILKMDPVTPDCVEKMPGWLRSLNGKKVRIRGFMKPGLLLSDIPQFMLVRDTGLCCFGPKGKIYDMIAVTLRQGTTTDYIELRPFDVVGTFRIEVLQLEEDGTIFGLYYIDDAVIIQK